ncbi:MAG: SDR family NAD(P)-dependent oxidoreductase [Saprospiraceae bacterium]|nr:SDR family NAD(P)-dependent oxidoreductase [Saprospiraceae bacterium]
MNAIITGATKGIGRATAEIFAQQGFNLSLIARHRKDLLKVKKDLESKFPVQIHIFPTDLAQKEEVLRLGDLIKTHWDTVDVLINNAGIFIQSEMLDEDDNILENMMNINLYAAYHLTRTIAPMMVERGKGHIFNLCSVASLKAYADSGSYTITKYAMLGFTRCLRLELQNKGVKVTAILPGSTNTASWEGSNIPSERLINPKEVAQAIWNAWNTGPTVCLEEILLRPMKGDL